GPVGERDRAEAVPPRPPRLEVFDEWPFRPPLGVERLIPEVVQALAIAVVEADGEARDVGRTRRFDGSHGTHGCLCSVLQGRRAAAVEVAVSGRLSPRDTVSRSP